MTDLAAGGNPLIVARQDTTQWYTGLGLVESVNDTITGIENGSWIDTTIGGLATGLDALATVLDPLGALASWGVAWLLEHVKPLSDALDWLAGDPDQITAYAQTWRNIAANSAQVADDYQTALTTQITDWGGTSAQTYRQHAANHIDGAQAIGRAAEAIGALVEGAGLLVALVRELVRDLIAEFVATLAVRLPLWSAEVGFTLGIASPYVASQVTALVAKWSARITKLINALINSLRRLAPIISRLDDIINDITDLLRRLSRSDPVDGPSGGHDTNAPPGWQTGGEVRPPRDDFDFEIRWADDAYDSFRSTNTDVDPIAETARDHGYTRTDIEDIKNHLFRQEHVLDMYPPPTTARFDANPRIAEAWLRLQRGDPHPADFDLLAHELYEARYMRETGDQSYSRAHQATIDAGHTWDPEAAAADGVGYQANQ